MNKTLATMAFAALTALNSQAAEWTPVQLALWNPLQVFCESKDVNGLRLDVIYGKNQDMRGLDLGIANNSRDVAGLELGVSNWTRGDVMGVQVGLAMNVGDSSLANVYGIQAAGVTNIAIDADVAGGQFAFGANNVSGGNVYGVQVSCWNGLAGDLYGAQLGLFNNTGDMLGAQASLANVSSGDVAGAQLGLLFNANLGRFDVDGAQAGLINYAESAAVNGFQFGFLANLNVDGSLDGASLGCVNQTKYLAGAQVGLVNLAKNTSGAQIGLINQSSSLHGFQLGLINIVSGPEFEVWPILNVSF